MFNSDQILIMCNIIAAVETEGQQYCEQCDSKNYGDFVEAYANSSIENSITIGRYQFYGIEAKELLDLIYSKDPSLFSKELLFDMNNKDWNNYKLKKDSIIANNIVNIISSKIGKECQDEFMSKQIQEYVCQAESLGITDLQAQAMSVNFIHQGGLSALTRILNKTEKPYSLENLYNACKSDTGNQVGAYKERQNCVYRLIKEHLVFENILNKQENIILPETIINIMIGWIGLSKADQSHKIIIDTYNSYLPHPRSYTASYFDDFCAITVSAAFIQANAVSLIGGIECGVERLIEDCLKPKGIWIEDDDITPIAGDIICFYWNETNKEKDNTGFASHIGIVEYVEDNIIHTIEGNTSGGKVARRTYEIGQACIRGYARPKYAVTQEIPTTTPVETAPTNLKKGSVGEEVKTMQSMLSACGYYLGEYGIDGDFGIDTEEAIKLFQTEHKLEMTGEYDQPTKDQLEKSYGNLQKEIPSAMFCIKSPKTYMRKGPSKDYEIIKMFSVGTKVRILSSKKVGNRGKLWYRVKRGEITGWIVASSLRV